MDSDGDGEDDPLNCVRPVLSQAKLQATHVARSCKAAIGKALRERASQDNFMRETETSTALDVSCRMSFFFRICLKKGFVERLMEISKKWIPIRRQNHQRVSALPRLAYRFAVHLWFPQWLLHTLPKLQRSCCMPSGRFHMHLEWFPSPWQFWLKKWEMLFHVWFILKFYSQLEIGFNDLLHYDSWISTFKLGIRYTVYRGIRYMRHVTSVMSQSAPTAVMSTDQDTFNRLYLRKSKMNVASIILDEETSFLKRLVSWQQWSVIVMLQKY